MKTITSSGSNLNKKMSNSSKKRVDFIPQLDFVQDLNYLSKLDLTILNGAKDAVSILRDGL